MFMHPSKEPRYSEPVWWSVQHTVLWAEYLPLLQSDFQRRTGAENRARITNQGPDDSVLQQAATTPRNVDVDHAYAVPDNNWEVGAAWEQIEPGLRYGVGARAQYSQFKAWNDELEAILQKEWSEANEPSTWQKVKRAVRRGFEVVHEKPS
jgi:hypothetical protein